MVSTAGDVSDIGGDVKRVTLAASVGRQIRRPSKAQLAICSRPALGGGLSDRRARTTSSGKGTRCRYLQIRIHGQTDALRWGASADKTLRSRPPLPVRFASRHEASEGQCRGRRLREGSRVSL